MIFWSLTNLLTLTYDWFYCLVCNRPTAELHYMFAKLLCCVCYNMLSCPCFNMLCHVHVIIRCPVDVMICCVVWPCLSSHSCTTRSLSWCCCVYVIICWVMSMLFDMSVVSQLHYTFSKLMLLCICYNMLSHSMLFDMFVVAQLHYTFAKLMLLCICYNMLSHVHVIWYVLSSHSCTTRLLSCCCCVYVIICWVISCYLICLSSHSCTTRLLSWCCCRSHCWWSAPSICSSCSSSSTSGWTSPSPR